MPPSLPRGKNLLPVLLTLLCTLSLLAAASVPSFRVDLADRIEYWEDRSAMATLEEARRRAEQGEFQRWLAPGDWHVGLSASAWWIRFSLPPVPAVARDAVVVLSYIGLDQIDFYPPDGAPLLTGRLRPLENRPYFDRFFVFPVTISGEDTHYYLRISGNWALTAPLTLFSLRDYLTFRSHDQLLQFLYFGGLLVLLLYNAFLTLSLRDVRFALFGGHLLSMGIAMFAGNGFGVLYLWPDSPGFDSVAQSTFLSLSGALIALFVREFLDSARQLPVIDRTLRAIAGVFLILAATLLASAVLDFNAMWANYALIIAGALLAISLPMVSLHAHLKGCLASNIFPLAWIVLSIGAVVAGGRALDWLPSNLLTAHAVQLASAGEMILLAMALADLVRKERDKRLRAQEFALRVNARLVEALKQSEARLESAVAERTSQLETAVAEQKRLLLQYVRFGSLISHEFRNPLSVILGQLAVWRKERPMTENRGIDIIAAAVSRLSLLFDRWLQGDRLEQLLQEPNLHRVDCERWLSKTLQDMRPALAAHRIDYTPQPGHASLEIDETLMDSALANLLENAAKYSPPGSRIAVSTVHQTPFIGIQVQDQGIGIEASQLELIFDEFYRIAPEGPVAGIGLGLALVKRIMAAHGGKVSVSSTPGEGSVFTLWLPVHP